MSRSVPVELTSFVGRRRELTDARRMLESARLVALVGPGGVGKTRLAGRLASQVMRQFSDGVVWVELAAQRDPASLWSEVAAALGVETRERSVDDAVAAYVAPRELLLVLDNCEHLLDACAQLATKLLGDGPRLRIVATSRQPLRVPGEHLMNVDPLSVPTPEETSAEKVERFEAVALLADRARAVDPGFRVDAANAVVVGRLCQQLDGIPLAIELAAARLRMLSVGQLADRLGERFDLLSAGPRTVAPRHRTLRGLVDWSFELCSSDEQALWARISVFEGGADLDAIESICAEPGADVFDAVAGLVDKSLLVPHADRDRVRYRQLETIRDYGRERLAGRGETDLLLSRHRDYFVAFAQTTEQAAFGPMQRDRFARTAAELPNLRTAHAACLAATESHPGAVVIFSSLFWHWLGGGALDEGVRWADRTLSGSLEPIPEALRALIRAAWLAIMTGDREPARRYAERLLALAPSVESDSAQLGALREEYGALRRGESSPAQSPAPSEVARITTRSARSLIAFLDGELEGAAHLDRGSLGSTSLSGQVAAETSAVLLMRTSVFMMWAGRPEEALRDVELALRICEEYGDEWWRSLLLCIRAACLTDLERHREALDSALDGLRMARGLNAFSVVNAVELAAQVNAVLDRGETAAVLFGALAGLWPGIGGSLVVENNARHEAGERRARDVLGDAGCAAAYERGRRMSVDEVVSFALGEPTTRGTGPEVGRDTSTVGVSRRELEVAELIARGLSNKDIAETLVISPRTAEGHVARLLQKLGFESRARVATWVAERRTHQVTQA